MPKFTCPICGDSFSAEGELAVCNGVNVKADRHGHPLNEAGERIISGSGDDALVLEETAQRVGIERDDRGRRRAKYQRLRKRRRLEQHEVAIAGHPATVMEVSK